MLDLPVLQGDFAVEADEHIHRCQRHQEQHHQQRHQSRPQAYLLVLQFHFIHHLQLLHHLVLLLPDEPLHLVGEGLVRLGGLGVLPRLQIHIGKVVLHLLPEEVVFLGGEVEHPVAIVDGLLGAVALAQVTEMVAHRTYGRRLRIGLLRPLKPKASPFIKVAVQLDVPAVLVDENLRKLVARGGGDVVVAVLLRDGECALRIFHCFVVPRGFLGNSGVRADLALQEQGGGQQGIVMLPHGHLLCFAGVHPRKGILDGLEIDARQDRMRLADEPPGLFAGHLLRLVQRFESITHRFLILRQRHHGLRPVQSIADLLRGLLRERLAEGDCQRCQRHQGGNSQKLSYSVHFVQVLIQIW